MKNIKKNGGFTLVELIVVIAILAILAAVAIPAYSGYIEKANKAGDEQLLNTLNKAFVSACNMNGVNPTALVNADAIQTKTDGGFKVEGLTGVPETINADFITIFGENKNTEFKVMEKIFYYSQKGMFFDKAANVTVQLGEKSYEISMEVISKFQNSVFANDVGAMQGQLTGISGAFGALVGSVDNAGTLSPELKAFMEANGYGDADVGNATVLFVAQNAGNYTANDIAQMFQDCSNYMCSTRDFSLGSIMQNAFDEDDDALTNIALMYGTVTAFANSDKCTDPEMKNTVANVSNGNDLINVFMSLECNTEWQSYIGTCDSNGKITASDQFTRDMNGFLGVMDALNTVSPGVDTGDTDFWQSDEVNKLLGSLLG